MKSKSKRLVANLIILALLLIILWVDDVIFRRWLGSVHWRWYLENGVEIGFIGAAVALVWNDFFESNAELVSAEPSVFYSAHFHLVGACIETMGVQLQSEPGKPRVIPVHEMIFGLPLLLIMTLGLFAWLFIVVPAQYFLVLLCGAPARVFLRAPYQLVLWYEGGRLRTEKLPREAEVPNDRMVASLSEKPVAVTNLFVALFLFVLGHFMGA